MNQVQVDAAIATFPTLTDEQLRKAIALGEPLLTATEPHWQMMGRKMADAARTELNLRILDGIFGQVAR
jgi:hypothetical protein